jgi:hypothetical protein
VHFWGKCSNIANLCYQAVFLEFFQFDIYFYFLNLTQLGPLTLGSTYEKDASAFTSSPFDFVAT